MKTHYLALVLVYFTWLGTVACSPTIQPTNPIENTPLPPATTAPAIPSPTSQPTRESTATTPPTTMPTATQLPATPPTQAAYLDVWVGGYFNHTGGFVVSNSSLSFISREPWTPLAVEPANATIGTELDNAQGGKLVLLTGDLHDAGSEDFYLVVKAFELLNLPYSAETPLEATYRYDDPAFSFNYPAGWFINPNTNPNITLHNAPPIVQERQLTPLGEHEDPSKYSLTISYQLGTTVADYLAVSTAEPSCVSEVEERLIANQTFTRLTEICYGVTYNYVIERDGYLFIFSGWLTSPDFIERIISTFE